MESITDFLQARKGEIGFGSLYRLYNPLCSTWLGVCVGPSGCPPPPIPPKPKPTDSIVNIFPYITIQYTKEEKEAVKIFTKYKNNESKAFVKDLNIFLTFREPITDNVKQLKPNSEEKLKLLKDEEEEKLVQYKKALDEINQKFGYKNYNDEEDYFVSEEYHNKLAELYEIKEEERPGYITIEMVHFEPTIREQWKTQDRSKGSPSDWEERDLACQESPLYTWLKTHMPDLLTP